MKTSFTLAVLLTTGFNSSAVFSNTKISIDTNKYAVVTPTVKADKLVTVYLLIDRIDTLQQYVNDLKHIDKPNFNRVIFSFVKPTMPNYIRGNLANTGILGYFDEGDGNGETSFNALKDAVTLSKEKNIQTFLSVGGWDYSCNYSVYKEACGGAPTTAIHYDWFPDPSDQTQKDIAIKSYNNIIQLSNDLGMDGIDVDYEEFWHADANAKPWSLTPDSLSAVDDINKKGGPSYQNLMNYKQTSTYSYIMPDTITKFQAILHSLADNPNAKNLLFATAAPPVGGRPVFGFVYGDNAGDIDEKGGLWWKGNLKGLWYNLNFKDPEIVSRFDSLGLMTYDICGDNATICAPYAGAKLDLPSQVDAYMHDYHNWLLSDNPRPGKLSVEAWRAVFLPPKFKIPAKLQFGFEVNQPAYPKNVNGQLQLTNALVDTITAQQKNNSSGVIIWQMYSKQNREVKDSTTVKYTINQSCKTFLGSDSRYDCNADFPSPAKS